MPSNLTPPAQPEAQKLPARDEHALIIGSLGTGQARRVLLPPTASKHG
jgi:hypothetical protein